MVAAPRGAGSQRRQERAPRIIGPPMTLNAALVIPALNEVGVIGDLVRRVPPGTVREVIVVDN